MNLCLTCSVQIFAPLAVSTEECAEYMIYNMLRPEHRNGAHFVSTKGDETNKSRYHGNDDIRAKVWQHAVEVTGLEDK